MSKTKLVRNLNTAETKKYRGRSGLAISLVLGNNPDNDQSYKVLRMLEKISNELTKDISSKYQAIFGKSPTWRDWVVNGEKAESIVAQKFNSSKGLASYRRKLKTVLKDIWMQRYQDIITKYSGAIGNYKTNPAYKAHYVRKRRARDGDRFGGNWPNTPPGKLGVSYVSPGLMSGYLRKSISDAIGDSIDGKGNDAFKVAASPTQIASVSAIEEGKDEKYMNAFYFLNRITKGSKGYSGISEFKRQRLFFLTANQMRDVSQLMSDAVVNDFIPELKKIISELKSKA